MNSEAQSNELPRWMDEAADPAFWDVTYGGYADGYFEWAASPLIVELNANLRTPDWTEQAA